MSEGQAVDRDGVPPEKLYQAVDKKMIGRVHVVPPNGSDLVPVD